MKKKFITILFIFITALMFSPINTKAMTVSDSIKMVSNNIYVLTDTDVSDEDIDECNAEGILGNPNDEDSVAWLLQQIFNLIKVVGPIAVVVLSSIDFIKVIVKSDDDAMAKAQKRLITRLILAALLFLIPTIVQVILQVFGITGDPTCGLR